MRRGSAGSWAVVVLVLALAGLQVRMYSRLTHAPSVTGLADPQIRSLAGKSLVFPSHGKLVLVFWAAWCPPCEVELRFLSRSLPAEGWYAINATDPIDSVREYAMRAELPAGSVAVGPASLLDRYRISAFPTIFLIEDGAVVETLVGGGERSQAKILQFVG